MILGTIFLVFAILLAFCVPIGGTIGIISLLAPYLEPGLPINAEFVFRHMVSAVDSFPLIAIPLFILSGLIMAEGGVSKRLFDVFAYIVGKRTAGMPAAVVITCLFYGAISGSAPATTAAVGAMCIPILVALGYDKIFVTALVATSGGLGVFNRLCLYLLQEKWRRQGKNSIKLQCPPGEGIFETFKRQLLGNSRADYYPWGNLRWHRNAHGSCRYLRSLFFDFQYLHL